MWQVTTKHTEYLLVSTINRLNASDSNGNINNKSFLAKTHFLNIITVSCFYVNLKNIHVKVSSHPSLFSIWCESLFRNLWTRNFRINLDPLLLDTCLNIVLNQQCVHHKNSDIINLWMENLRDLQLLVAHILGDIWSAV